MSVSGEESCSLDSLAVEKVFMSEEGNILRGILVINARF